MTIPRSVVLRPLHGSSASGSLRALACAALLLAGCDAGRQAFISSPRLFTEESETGESPVAAVPPGEIHLVDVTASTGIHFQHDDGGSGEKYLVEAMSAGLALFDYDGDGLVDIYLLNGAPLSPRDDAPRGNALFRNEGNLRFREVTQEVGIGDLGYGLGVAVGDYTGNGFPDLYVNNFGSNVLYRNNGDGTFTDATAEAGVACGDWVGAGASFLDIDGNGLLDLYVANYTHFNFKNHVRRTIDGFHCYPGPLDYEPVPDCLYRNNGDGTFSDISEASGIAAVAGTGMGIVCGDFDNDGDTDIFVANDMRPNFLFENDGTGKFKEVGLARGVAYNSSGKPNGNMGVDCADYNQDGWLDLFSTTFSGELPVLYHNLGSGLFKDATLASGAGAGSRPHVNWGTGFVDFDNSGHPDLFVAHGHLDQDVHLWDTRTLFRVRNVLLKNTGQSKFVDISDRCGEGLHVAQSSRGAGFDDLNNNGRLDAVILNSRDRPTILENVTQNDHRWLKIRLRGTRTNRDGIGAQVRVTTGDRTQLSEVHSGRGYQSHYGLQLHFGLGSAERVDRIEVRWIGGGVDVLEDVDVDQRLLITEGRFP